MLSFCYDRKELEKHIASHWMSKEFMEELFEFLNYAVSVESSEKLQQKLVIVCSIITKLYFPENRGRGWFRQFRHTMYLLEQYFL